MTLFNRRNFLSTAGAAAAATVLGGPRFARADATPTPKKLAMLYCRGGWDISYALDPKPGVVGVDSPVGDVQMFEDLPILTDESRPNITAFFEAYGPLCAVVNGIQVSSISHDVCRVRMMTGNSSATMPDAGAILGHQLGRDLPAPYMSLGGPSFAGPLGVSTTRVGATNQIAALLDPDNRYPLLPGSPYAHEGYVPTGADEDLIRDYVESRAQRMQLERAAKGFNRARIEDFLEALDKGDELRLRADDFGELGVDMNLQQQVNLALRALGEDLAWSVNLSVDGFDTHDDNEPQGPLQDAVYGGLLDFAEALENAPGSRAGSSLLDETIVLVFSEMSRTPRLNAEGGKDHHPVTSALMFGGGVQGGRAYGGTTDLVEAMLVDYETGEASDDGGTLTTGAFLSGLVQSAGGDASEYVTNATPFAPMCP